MKNPSPCIFEKRLFFFWRRSVIEHDYKIVSIEKFMLSSTDFVVRSICERCQKERVERFVDYDKLLKAGISAEVLNSISEWPYYFPAT